MRCEAILTGYAEGAGMTGQDGSGDGFARRIQTLFATEVLTPLVLRAAKTPEEVRALVSELREQLGSLDRLLSGTTPAGGAAGMPAPSVRAAAPAPGDNRYGEGRQGDGHQGEGRDGDGLDEVGRNQRSRLRELAMLEAMAREERPYALQQITAALDARGFADTSGAIVSQLHRLKKLGVIDQPANGMYVLTDQGLGHLRRLRTSFGALMGGG